MGYMAYKGQSWLISSSNVEDCKVGDTVTFIGPSDAVTVRCTDANGKTRKPYNPGRYEPRSNKIEKQGEYEISMRGSTIIFTVTQQSGRLRTRDTGSWTAEDNGPWPGEDEA